MPENDQFFSSHLERIHGDMISDLVHDIVVVVALYDELRQCGETLQYSAGQEGAAGVRAALG